MARKEQTNEQEAAAKAAAEQEDTAKAAAEQEAAAKAARAILADPSQRLTYGEILDLQARAAAVGA